MYDINIKSIKKSYFFSIFFMGLLFLFFAGCSDSQVKENRVLPTNFELKFIDKFDVEPSSQVNSNTVTLLGFDGNVNVKVINADAMINGGFILHSGETRTLSAGTTIQLITMSSSDYSTKKTSTLQVNDKSFYFSTTTKSDPNSSTDTTPNSFNLGKKLNVEPSTTVQSDEIVVSGLSENIFVDVNIIGGTYSINDIDKNSSTSKVKNGDKIVVKIVTSSKFSSSKKATLNIGGVSGDFVTITRTKEITNTPTSPSHSNVKHNISGVTQKGPFATGSMVKAYELVNGVRSGSVVQTTTYDNKGNFNFNSLPWTNPTQIVITGYYFDEVTGYYRSDGNLSVVIKGGTGKIYGGVNANVLTQITSARIIKLLKDGKTFDEAYTQANNLIKEKFNLDLPNGKGPESLDLTKTDKPDNAKLLQISSALLSTQNPQKVLEDIVDDAKDGDLGGKGDARVQEIKDKIKTINLSEVSANIDLQVGSQMATHVDQMLQGKLPVDFELKFIDKFDVEPSTQINSNIVTLLGFDGDVTVEVINANAMINGSAILHSGATRTLPAGTTIKLITISSSDYSTQNTATLKVNGKSFYFSTTTKSDPNSSTDTTPNSFNLGKKLNVEPSTTIQSDKRVVSGLSENIFVDINITGGTYSINGVDKGSTASSVTNGDKIKVNITTLNQFSHLQKATLNIGGVSGNFITVTRPRDITPNPFTIASKYNIDKNTPYITEYVTLNGFEGDLPLIVENGKVQVEGDSSWNTKINSASRGIRVRFKQISKNDFDKRKTTTIKLGNYQTTFKTITKANPALMDYVPTHFDFPIKRIGIADGESISVESDGVAITGIANGNGINIKPNYAHTQIKINSGNWTNGVITGVKAGDILKVKVPNINNSSPIIATVISYYDNDKNKYKGFAAFRILTHKITQTPNDINFTNQKNVNSNGTYFSNTVTISGLSSGVEVNATIVGNGAYAKNGSWNTVHNAKNIKLKNGDTIQFRLTFFDEPEGETESMFLNFKNKSFSFSVTTNKAPIFQTTPSFSNIEVGDHISFTPRVIYDSTLTFSLQNAPSWMSINTTTGHITGSVALGTYQDINLTATDSEGLSSSVIFSILVNPPLIKPELSGKQNQEVRFKTRAEHEYIYYSFIPNNAGGRVQSWSITNKPIWADFNTTSGELYGTPSLEQNGTYSNIQITATNNSGSDTFSFNIHVLDKTPTKLFRVKDYYGVEINKYYDTFITVDWLSNGQSVPISSSGYNGQPSHSGFTVNGNNNVGTVQNGDIVRVGHFSSNEYNTELHTTLTIGNSSDDFITKTKTSSSTKLPLIVGSPRTNANANEEYSYTPQMSTDYTRFAPVTHGFKIQNKPNWATFNETTGELKGTPTAQGVYKYVKIIAYGDDGIDDITFDITVSNNAPYLSPVGQLSLDSANLNFTFSDNPTWRSKINEVSIYNCYSQTTPIVLDSSDYTFGNGTLQLHVSTSQNVALHTPSMGGARLIIKAQGYNDNEVLMDFINDGQYAIKAELNTTSPLLESDLDGAVVHLTLKNSLRFKDATLDKYNFALADAPDGLYIHSVSYIDQTHADITLSYYGNDFDTDRSMLIEIDSSELNSCDTVRTTTLPIVAVVETPYKQVLYPDDPSENAHFGYSVADKNDTIAVGSRTGVYIYQKHNGRYIQTQKIPPVDTGSISFGESIAIDGDYLVIGDSSVKVGEKVQAGNVYIYKRWAGVYSFVATLSPSDLEAYAHFGSAVDISHNMIIVGAYNALKEPDRGGRGKAYLFKNDGNDNFNLVETITRANGKPFDWFGYDVAVTCDSVETNKYYLVVGSNVYPDYIQSTDTTDLKTELGAGFANYYTYINNTLSNPVIIKPTDSTNLNDHFGRSVSMHNYTIAIGGHNGIYFYKRASDTVGDDGKIATVATDRHNLEAIYRIDRKVVVAGTRSYVFNSDGTGYDEYNTSIVGNNIGYSASIDGFEVARGMYSNSDLATQGGAVLVTNAYENITSLTNSSLTPPNVSAGSGTFSLDSDNIEFSFDSDNSWKNAISKIMYKTGAMAQYVELQRGTDYIITSDNKIKLLISTSTNSALHTPYTSGSLLIKADGYLDKVVTITSMNDGTYGVKATLSSDNALNENNLNGSTLHLALLNTLAFTDSSLDSSNFTLIGTPNGCTVSNVTYIDTTHVNITLAFDGTDFDDNKTLQVAIDASKLNNHTTVTTNTLPITANVGDSNTIPNGATVLEDINITISVNSSKHIDLGFEDSTVSIYTQPTNGNAQAVKVGGESWNLIYTISSCYVGEDSFIYKKGTNEYGRVNITIQGVDFGDDRNRTISMNENERIFALLLSKTYPVTIKTEPSHGTLNPYLTDLNTSKFNYFPTKGYSGNDYFEYNITKSLNQCTFKNDIRVEFNISALPPQKVAVSFPNNNGDCTTAMTDGNNSITFSTDTTWSYDACTIAGNGFEDYYKVGNRFLYQAGDAGLHAIKQDATVFDVNTYQRNSLKTSQIILSRNSLIHPYIKNYAEPIYYPNGIWSYRYKQALIFNAYTPVDSDTVDMQIPMYGTLPWATLQFNTPTFNNVKPMADIVGDTIDADKVITSFASLNGKEYFLGYDGANGNGIGLQCFDMVYDSNYCEHIYLNSFDEDVRDTTLSFSNTDIVSVRDQSLLFTYSIFRNSGSKAKLYISDGEDDFSTNDITYHVKLISSDEYDKLDLEKSENTQRVFYKGKNLTTNKTEIGYITEHNHNGIGYQYLLQNNLTMPFECRTRQGSTDHSCSTGLLDRDFWLEKLVEFDGDSKFLVSDNNHVYYTNPNNKLYMLNGTTNTEIDVGLNGGGHVESLQKIGNYIYVLISSNTVEAVRLWVIDPATNQTTMIEDGVSLSNHKHIKLFFNPLKGGNQIIYSLIKQNADETQYLEFKLYSYDASTGVKRLISTQTHFNKD